jgi:hypothetical protein
MPDGELTAKAARELQKCILLPGFEVLFDHGDTSIDSPAQVGNISSWFGPVYSSVSQLALLDIAVVDRSRDQAAVLVEIEETSSNPKVAIGDAFGTILGDHITFQGKRELEVGNSTLLVILLRNGQTGHIDRLQYLQEKITASVDPAQTGNSIIGRILFDFFANEEDLVGKLTSLVNEHLASYSPSK